jgi:hypothetical protein
LSPAGQTPETRGSWGEEVAVSILWIVLIVLLILALLGYFGRGRFYG